MIEFISATRLTKDEFWEKSALGRSLLRIDPVEHERFVARVAYENRRGLPDLFNERIEAAAAENILVFLHDDLWIDDLFICDHLEEALHEFQVIGVSGNVRRTPMQPAWSFKVTGTRELRAKRSMMSCWNVRTMMTSHMREITCAASSTGSPRPSWESRV